MQLMECCSDQLRMDLTRIAGGSMADNTEGEVLAAMKSLAVKKVNKMVAIDALQRMSRARIGTNPSAHSGHRSEAKHQYASSTKHAPVAE